VSRVEHASFVESFYIIGNYWSSWRMTKAKVGRLRRRKSCFRKLSVFVLLVTCYLVPNPVQLTFVRVARILHEDVIVV
jgi:hypothetical protein